MLHKKRDQFKFQEKIIINTFGRLPITPNQWTLTGLMFSFIGLYFVIVHDIFLALMFFIISMFLDFVDGTVARARDMVSDNGAYLDTMIDRYSQAIMIFGFFFISELPVVLLPVSVWIFLILFGSMVTTYSKAAANEKGLSKKVVREALKHKMLIKKAERDIFAFLIYILILCNQPYLAVFILILFAIFTNITAIRKISLFMKYNNEIGNKTALNDKKF